MLLVDHSVSFTLRISMQHRVFIHRGVVHMIPPSLWEECIDPLSVIADSFVDEDDAVDVNAGKVLIHKVSSCACISKCRKPHAECMPADALMAVAIAPRVAATTSPRRALESRPYPTLAGAPVLHVHAVITDAECRSFATHVLLSVSRSCSTAMELCRRSRSLLTQPLIRLHRQTFKRLL